MLVLSRKISEVIVIGTGEGRVLVHVVRIDGDKVRLGIEAGKTIPVHRLEVYNKIHGEGGDLAD